jgi:hypothetical protein
MPDRGHEMQDTTRKLSEPARDIRYLLKRNYPRSGAIRFVSNHYRLSEQERHILTRVIVAPHVADSRSKKRLGCTDIKGRDVLVDGYNVLITIESMLNKETLWLGDDGYVRDTKGVFRNYAVTDITYEAVDMMLTILAECKVGSATILLDSQMSNSGELARVIRNKLTECLLDGDARTSRHVDFDLKNAGEGVVVATADGVIIDAVREVVDIGRCLMERRGFRAGRID